MLRARMVGGALALALGACSAAEDAQIEQGRLRACALYEALLPEANAFAASGLAPQEAVLAFQAANLVIQPSCSAPGLDAAGLVAVVSALAEVQKMEALSHAPPPNA